MWSQTSAAHDERARQEAAVTLEHSHGKARPTLPRSRELAVLPTDGKPNRSRDARGRFTGLDSPSNGRGWKQLIGRMAGRELKGEAAELGRAAWRLYLAQLEELPHTGPNVRSLVAAQARSAILSARYAQRAAELGLDTLAGRAALDMSAKLDARAERLAVTALDIAIRLAKAQRAGRVVDAHARVLEAFGAPVPPKPEPEGAA